jgi:enterochelin esterase-like enzyme
LPPGYNELAKAQTNFPVLYMFEGQSLFDSCTALSGDGELKLDETMTKLISSNAIPTVVVVGIDSSSDSDHEYSPYKDSIANPESREPIGKELPAFLAADIIPYVSQHYRVSSNADEVGIGGTSLGAVAALYVARNRSDLFGLALLESPPLLFGNAQLLRDTSSLARGPTRIAIGIGARELQSHRADRLLKRLRLNIVDANAGFVKMTETLAANLGAAYMNHPDVLLAVDPNGTHTPASWADHMPNAITSYIKLPIEISVFDRSHLFARAVARVDDAIYPRPSYARYPQREPSFRMAGHRRPVNMQPRSCPGATSPAERDTNCTHASARALNFGRLPLAR